MKKEDIKNFTTIAVSKDDLKAVHYLKNVLQCRSVEDCVHLLIRKSLELFGTCVP